MPYGPFRLPGTSRSGVEGLPVHIRIVRCMYRERIGSRPNDCRLFQIHFRPFFPGPGIIPGRGVGRYPQVSSQLPGI